MVASRGVPEDADPVVSVHERESVAARAYRERVARWQDLVRSNSRGVGGVYVPIRPDQDIETLLLTSWREAGVLR